MKKKKKDINNTQPNKGVNCDKQIHPYKTIKTSLKSIIKTPEIQKIINDLVIKCNDIIIDTYQFIRLYNLKKYIDTEKMIVDSKKTDLRIFKNALIYKSNYLELCNIMNGLASEKQ